MKTNEQIARQIAGAMMGAMSESQHKTSVNLVNLEDFAATAALRALEQNDARVKELEGLLRECRDDLRDWIGVCCNDLKSENLIEKINALLGEEEVK